MNLRKFYFLLLLFIFNSQAVANLLDKVQLEEALQSRLEESLSLYDKDIKVRVKFTYRSSNSLPGVVLDENTDLSPNTIGESDIRSINVEIQSSLSNLSKEMENDIYGLIPVRKSRIKIKYTQIGVKNPTPVPPPIVRQDLWDMSKAFSNDISQLFTILFAVCSLLLSALVFYVHRSSIRNSRENFNLLAKAVSESTPGSLPTLPTFAESSQSESRVARAGMAAMDSKMLDLPIVSLVELFADCYWCEQDNYAHWLWSQLNSNQKASLLNEWPLMKRYSQYFVHQTPYEQFEHQHPYYLAPENLHSISQEILQKEVKSKPELWLRLSPLRQSQISMPISEKLRIVKKIEIPPFPKLTSFSKERMLPLNAALGELSFQDEKALLADPNIIPLEMRPQFSSLIWLSLQSKEYIESVLSQYDAPSLASAWVGDPDVLLRLEDCLPEKKRKMVLSYVSKIAPNKNSSVFVALVKAGFNREAA